MLQNFYTFSNRFKYEVLLVALLMHLYIGIFLTDLVFYTRIIWPINMLILGVASVGIFYNKKRIKRTLKNSLLILVFLLPIANSFLGHIDYFMSILSILYCIFFGFILIEIMQYLLKPSYINTDIISASACGLFLIIEITVFLLQTIFYIDPNSLTDINTSQPAAIYMDLVYFSSITVTTIGYGDISPNAYNTKLIVSLLGVISQFYTVVLIGILIGKFVSQQEQNEHDNRKK